MSKRRLIILLLIFLSWLDGVVAQRITVFGKTPVRLDGQGFLLGKMRQKEIPDDAAVSTGGGGADQKEKTVGIYLAGNSIDMQTTDLPFGSSLCFSDRGVKNDSIFLGHYQRHRLYYHAYYTRTPITGQSEIPDLKMAAKYNWKRRLHEGDDLIYAFLKVNDFFFVDFFDYDTDTLVRRYFIKRVKITPEISGYQPLNDQQTAISGIIPISEHHKITLSPDRKNRLILSNNSGLPDSTIQYNLINLKTRDTIYHNMGGSQMIIPALDANTEYALQLNYSMQPETIVVYYIWTKPYWYQSSLLYILVGVVVILAAVFAGLYVMRRKIRLSRLKQAETEQHLRTVQSQLNPHFTFNALSSIQGLINTNKIDEANHYLQDFSLLLRQTLKRSQHIFNSLDRDIEMIRTYIGIEQLRFNFNYDIRFSGNLVSSEIEIPTLLIQPLVENAIKHGISGLGDKGKVVIECGEGREAGSMILSVKDNGRGFDNLAADSGAGGYGIKLTRERIAAINHLANGKSIDLIFRTGPGTEAILTFHHWIDK